MPGAQDYYVSGQHNILGTFATKLLSCWTVWNVLWILKRYMYIIKPQWQWFVLRLFIRIHPAGDATVPHLHSADLKAASFLHFSSKACNSTMQIRTHSPIQCFCSIKQNITIGQFWCNGITILTVFRSCHIWLLLLISTHSFIFGCFGYLILQFIINLVVGND